MTTAVVMLLPYGRLLSPAEAQQHLGIPASTIRTWHQRRARTQLYSAGLLGRAPLFYEADLLAAQRGLPIRDDRGVRINTLRDLLEVDETPIR